MNAEKKQRWRSSPCIKKSYTSRSGKRKRTHDNAVPEMLDDLPEIIVLFGRPLRAGQNDILIVFSLKAFKALPRGSLETHFLRDLVPVSEGKNHKRM